MIKNWKNISILILLSALLIAAGTSSNDWYIGDGSAGDKSIVASNADANKPALKYDDTADKWQFSNNGTSFTDMGGGGGGGNTYAATYGETITAGDALEVRADGKAYKIKPSTVDSSNFEYSLESNIFNPSVVFDKSSGKHIEFGLNNTNLLGARVLDLQPDGTLDRGPLYLYSITGINQSYGCSDGTNNKVFAFGDSGTNIFAMNLSVNDRSEIVFENFVTNANPSSDRPGTSSNVGRCSYNAAQNKTMMTYRSASDSFVKMQYVSSLDAPTWGSVLAVNSGTASLIWDVKYDEANNVYVVSYFTGNDGFVVGVDGSTPNPTLGTPVQFATTSGLFHSLAYDKVEGGWAVFYKEIPSSFARAFSMSGTTITLGNIANIGGSNNVVMASDYNESKEKIYLYIDNGSSNDVRMSRYNSDGTDVSFVDDVVASYTTVGTPSSFNSVFYSEGDSNLLFSPISISGYLTFNINSKLDQYDSVAVAVASEAGITNDVKDVTVTGVLHTGFSGKTAGDKAYLQDNGTISEVKSGFYVGAFVDSETLVFTGIQKDIYQKYVLELNSTINVAGSGTFTNGICNVHRVSHLVTLSCPFLNHSSSTSPATAVGLLPLWATPSTTYANMYWSTPTDNYTLRVVVNGSFNFLYKTWTGATSTAKTSTGNGFMVSYYVD